MAAADSLLALLSSPPIFFSVSLAVLLSALRARAPWTPRGGLAMLTILLSGAALGLLRPRPRARLLDPEQLPAVVLGALAAIALWLALRQSAATEPGAIEPRTGFTSGEHRAGAVVVFLIVFAAIFFDPMASPVAGIGSPLDPLDSADAPWFLASFGEARRFLAPAAAGWLMPAAGLLMLLAIPWFDQAATVTRSSRLRLFAFGFFLVVWLPMIMTLFLRDPGRVASGPEAGGESLYGTPIATAPLSQIVWERWLGWHLPEPWLIRELPGLLLLALLVLLPRQLTRWPRTRGLFQRARDRLGKTRYTALLALALLALSLPLKMYSQWLLGVSYLVDLPEIGLRF